jgi:CBS domain
VSLLGDPLNSILLVISGWFLGSAARGLDRRAAVEDLLDGLRVDDVMERQTQSVAPQLTLDTFAGQYIDSPQSSSLAVMRGDSLLGLIGVSELRRIARSRWPTTRAEQVMVAAPALPVLAPELPMRSGLEELRRTGLDGLPVSRGAELLGILTRRSVVAAIQRRAGEQEKTDSRGPRRWRRPLRGRSGGAAEREDVHGAGDDDSATPPAGGA